MATVGSLAITLAGILGPMIAVRFMLGTIGIRLPGLIGLLKLLFAPIRMLAGLLIGPLVSGLRVVSIALWGLAANPVVLAIAAVVAVLAGAAYLIYRNWDAVKAYLLGNGKRSRQVSTAVSGHSFNPDRRHRADQARGPARRRRRDRLVQDKLGIHSPSRVFADLGGFTMVGLAQGLGAGQAGPLGVIASRPRPGQRRPPGCRRPGQ